jgi:cell division protein FtsB
MYFMPWVKHSSQSTRFYWILAGICSVLIGILSGYSWWGDTASVVTLVEQQLSQSQAQVRMLEKRVKALETKLGIDSDSAASDSGIKAY